MARSSVPVTKDQQQTAIMLFARVPVAGLVKTRLIPALGADGACRLHRAMLQRSLEALAQTTAAERQLWLAGDSRDQAVDIAQAKRRFTCPLAAGSRHRGAHGAGISAKFSRWNGPHCGRRQ